MTKSIDVPRLRWLLLGAKTLVTIALLFALTMPLSTCSVAGSVQQHRVEFSRYEISTIACFFWPVPLLIAQFSIRRVRHSFAILVIESIAAAVAWAELTMGLLLSAVVSLGGIHPADGYYLAASSIMGYFILSVLQLALSIVAKRVTLPATA